MIKFFRNIRQKLLSENKLSKYLIYALGEILLVVFGILIALQVNNANETRKARVELDVFYKNIREEMMTNLDDLSLIQRSTKENLNVCKKVLLLMGATDVELKDVDVDSLLEETILFYPWRPSSLTVNELKSSGNFTNLQSPKFKNLLFEWERITEFIERQNEFVTERSFDITDYINKNASIRKMNYKKFSLGKSKLRFDNKVLFNDLTFENLVDTKIGYLTFYEKYMNEAEVLIEEILQETSKD